MSKSVSARIIALSVCGVLTASIFAMAACSKTQQNQAAVDTSSVLSDAGTALSDTGSQIADAVTPDTPQDFANKVAVANTFEIETSKLALKTSKNADVLAFAKKMVADHTQAGKDFEAAITRSGAVTAPAKALDDAHQSKLDDLKVKSGDDFDKAYISDQKDAHSDAVSLFDNYSKNGDDAALKGFAAKTLPTLQSHKDMIDKM